MRKFLLAAIGLVMACLSASAVLVALQAQVHAATPPPATPIATCQTNGRVQDVLFHNGIIFLAGEFTQVRPAGVPLSGTGSVLRNAIAACNASTGTVLDWDPHVVHSTTANLLVQTLALSPDGATLYFGGRFTSVGGITRTNIAAVSATSGVSLAWNPTLSAGTKVNDIVLSPDGGTAFFGGWFGIRAWTTQNAGVQVAGFAPVLRKADATSGGTVASLALSTDGQTLYAGGSDFFFVNGQSRVGAAAVDAATGKSTTGFAPVISDTKPGDLYPQIYDIRVAGQQVYLCGDWWTTEGIGEQSPDGRQRNVGRFDATTGKADLTWLPWTDGGVQGCDLDLLHDVLLMGGHFDKVGQFTDTVAAVPFTRDLAAVDLQTGQPLAWQPGTSSTAGVSEIWAVDVSGDWIVVGGEFGAVAGMAQQNLAVFKTNAPSTATSTATATATATATPTRTPTTTDPVGTGTPRPTVAVQLPLVVQ